MKIFVCISGQTVQGSLTRNGVIEVPDQKIEDMADIDKFAAYATTVLFLDRPITRPVLISYSVLHESPPQGTLQRVTPDHVFDAKKSYLMDFGDDLSAVLVYRGEKLWEPAADRSWSVDHLMNRRGALYYYVPYK